MNNWSFFLFILSLLFICLSSWSFYHCLIVVTNLLWALTLTSLHVNVSHSSPFSTTLLLLACFFNLEANKILLHRSVISWYVYMSIHLSMYLTPIFLSFLNYSIFRTPDYSIVFIFILRLVSTWHFYENTKMFIYLVI